MAGFPNAFNISSSNFQQPQFTTPIFLSAPAVPTNPVIAPPPPPPPQSNNLGIAGNWIEHTTDDNRKYYYNTATKQTTWEKPIELKSQRELILASCPWKEYSSQNGNPYYYNEVTKQSVWSKPQELIDVELRASQASTSTPLMVEPIEAPALLHTPHTPATPNDAAPEPSAIEKAMMATLGYEAATVADDTSGIPMPGNDVTNDSSNIPPPPDIKSVKLIDNDMSQAPLTEYKTRGEMAEGMRRLFRDCNVPGSSTWEQALKLISSNPRFSLLRHFTEKKQIFNVYKTQRLKEEREEQRVRAKKAREELERFLLSHSDLESTMSYKQVGQQLSDAPEWTVVPDRDRRGIFNEVMQTISRREREQVKVLRKRNIKLFSEILKEIPKLTYKTTWSQAQQMLLDNEKLTQDDDLRNLDKEDALVCFENHICALEQQHDAEKETERRKQKRQQRKHREAFLVLLDELNEHKMLTATSLWKELYPVIRRDDRFDVMLAQRGSTPLDLFKFFVEKLKNRFPAEKKLIKEILKDTNHVVDLNSTFEDFSNLVDRDPRSRGLDRGNLRMAFQALYEKAQNRERERQREEARRNRKLDQAFCDALSDANFIQRDETSWEEVRERMANHPAFKALPLESERIRVFKEYLLALDSSRPTADETSRSGRKEKRRDKSPIDHRSSAISEDRRRDKISRKRSTILDPNAATSDGSDGSDDSKPVEKSKRSGKHRHHKTKKSKKHRRHKHHRSKKRRTDDGELEEGEALDDEEEDADSDDGSSSVDGSSRQETKKKHKRSRRHRTRPTESDHDGDSDGAHDSSSRSKRRRH